MQDLVSDLLQECSSRSKNPTVERSLTKQLFKEWKTFINMEYRTILYTGSKLQANERQLWAIQEPQAQAFPIGCCTFSHVRNEQVVTLRSEAETALGAAALGLAMNGLAQSVRKSWTRLSCRNQYDVSGVREHWLAFLFSFGGGFFIGSCFLVLFCFVRVLNYNFLDLL